MIGSSKREQTMTCMSRRDFAGALGVSLIAGPVRAQSRNASPAGFKGQVLVNERAGIRFHTYLADPSGAMVTSHIVETPSGIVLVDGQLSPASARELKAYLAGLGKPIRKVILSHAHPDHWFGFHHVGQTAIHAGPRTATFITANAAAVVSDRKADSAPPSVAGVLAEGEERIDGVLFRYSHVLDTEAPEIVTVEVPAAATLIAQDLVYNKVHAVVSRQIDRWTNALTNIERAGSADRLILPGHGEPATPADLPGLVRYLNAVKPLLQANIGKPDQAKAITEEIAKAFPEYRLPPLLTLGLSRALPA
jgi:glyoxylase-like metal-dependent hydrolase (beta-lactamase superfamily II)